MSIINIVIQIQVVLGKFCSLDEYCELYYLNLEELDCLIKMVNDMFWLVQSEYGLLKLIWELFDMNQEVCELFEFFEVLVEEKQVWLEIEGQVFRIMGDCVMFWRVFLNLFFNVLCYFFLGESVKVCLEQLDDGQVLFSVQNVGLEIFDEYQFRIFD